MSVQSWEAMRKFKSTLQMVLPDLKLVPYEAEEVLVVPRIAIRQEQSFLPMPYRLKNDDPNFEKLQEQVQMAMSVYTMMLERIIANPEMPELHVRETRSSVWPGNGEAVNLHITTNISEHEYIEAAKYDGVVSYIGMSVEGGSVPYDDKAIRKIFTKTIGHMVSYRWAEYYVFGWTCHEEPAFIRVVK